MKAVVAAFNQEKALVGAFPVITNLRMELFQALIPQCLHDPQQPEELRDPPHVVGAGGGVAGLGVRVRVPGGVEDHGDEVRDDGEQVDPVHHLGEEGHFVWARQQSGKRFID